MSIDLIKTSSETLIILPKEFRNEIWGEQFGKVQQELRKESQKEKLIISLLKCEWSDPLPMLSLFISILENKNKYSQIEFNLNDQQNLNLEQRVFLAFFLKEGFMNILKKNGISVLIRNDNNKRIINEDYISSIKAFETNLYYIDSTILEADVLDINELIKNKSSIDNYIQKILLNVQHRLRSKIKASNFSQVNNRIELFLKETIENVNEHAYDNNSEKKLVGIYIRYRIGLINNTLSKEHEIKLRKAYNKESSKKTRLLKTFAEEKTGFIEIFVIDGGIGITENYYFEKQKKLFRNAWRETAGLGGRNINSRAKKSTNFGGLYALSRICAGNYLLARDYNEWIGDVLPVVGNNEDFEANRSYSLINSEVHINGLALLARISWNEVSDDTNDWAKLDLGKDKESHSAKLFIEALYESKDIYFKYYKNHFNNLKEKPFFIIEERVNTDELNLNLEYLNNKQAYDYAFYLPFQGNTKNKIHSIIEDKFSKLDSNIKSIIIGDIPVWEAGVYRFALEKAAYNHEILKKIDSIILITKRMSVLILKKQQTGRTFVFDKEKSDEFIRSTKVGKFQPDESLKHYTEFIKTHDSMLFWQHIKNENLNQEYFLYEKIEWYQGNQDIGLIGYLNFAKTLNDSFCIDIYENALERTLCLANENGCKYESIDILTSKISSQFNSKFYNIPKLNSIRILLGSVFVSGYSEKSTEIKNINEKADFKIHFFYNRSITNQNLRNDILQLLLWPIKGENWFKENIGVNSTNKNFERVGGSYVIAPGGWKYFPLPRFRLYDKIDKRFIDDNINIEFDNKSHLIYKSVYKQNPKSTYQDWQGRSNSVISIGHIEYEGNHDLFKIDIPFIVEESFLMGTELSQFLMGEFLYAMGGNQEDLSDKKNTRLSSGVKTYMLEEYPIPLENTINSVIIYPYHFNNEHVISLIKKNINKKFHDRFFALFPLNKERSTSSFLTSPLTIEAIKKKILTLSKSNKKVDAILFDDAIVTGKTRKEIKHLLYNLGISKIRTISIIERRRLPFSTSNPNLSKAFWRLDIPKMGNAENCYLCSSIKILEDFKINVVSENVLKRIKSIQNYWSATIPHNINDEKLPPFKLNLKQTSIHKKFGVYYDIKSDDYLQCGGEENLIELYNSLGLTIYCSELHTMTSTDKMVTKFVNDETITKEAKIELISCYLMLFNNEINAVIKEKLIIQLFEYIKNNHQSNYSSFALLALLNQGRDKLEILYEISKDSSQADIYVRNFDMLILCSYLALNSNSNFSHSKKAIRLLKKYKSLRDLYKQFHSEIFNDYGIIHDTPLQLINKGEYRGDTNIINNAQDSCDKLLFLINEIPDWQSRLNNHKYPDTGHIENVILEFKQKTSLDRIPSTKKYFYEVKEIIERIFNNLKPFHQGFFVPLGKHNGELTFRQHLIDLVNRNNNEKDIILNNYIKFSKKFIDLPINDAEIKQKWIIYDKNIENFIFEVLTNVRHAPQKIQDPFYDDQNLSSTGWLNVDYYSDKIELKLKNYSQEDSSKIEERMNSKVKQARIDASDLGVRLELSSVEINTFFLLETKFIIPIL